MEKTPVDSMPKFPSFDRDSLLIGAAIGFFLVLIGASLGYALGRPQRFVKEET